MKKEITINGRLIGPGHPTYIIAEMSGNHGKSFDKAVEIIHAMKEAGADAAKLQTFTADTITIKSDREEFKINGTLWDGKTLYELYEEASTPWEWYPKLKEVAQNLDIDLFSTPFDPTAADFLEEMDVPAYKIASFELVDIPLIKHVAKKGKPIIMSTGMGTLEEIREAVSAVQEEGNDELVILKCTSAYPALPEEMNLRTIPDIAKQFSVPVGLSDHTMGFDAPIAAVTLGACVIEKHFCLSRNEPGLDTAFSLEPNEFKDMVDSVRAVESGTSRQEVDEKVLGEVRYGPSDQEKDCAPLRRSLYAVENIAKGEEITEKNVRSIRPGNGLPPKELHNILKRNAAIAIKRGTPLSWELIDK
ncbi:pseudaminic acid synthase [Patescibacteria group bacterium]|nr:pseudaminic acid synthase [Patescibacteria group bacterium]